MHQSNETNLVPEKRKRTNSRQWCPCKHHEVEVKKEKAPSRENERVTKELEEPMEIESISAEESIERNSTNSDGEEDLWKEFAFSMESSKETHVDALAVEDDTCAEGEGEDCDHSFIMKDDIGEVCRICGIIKQSIDTIIDYQFGKVPKKEKTYQRLRAMDAGGAENLPEGIQSSSHEFPVTELHVHPRHRRDMKHHQVEGFKFLQSNLATDNPGGCIMAHAPGSGKTFMMICFLQSFKAKYHEARPLVVLPRGIVATWKTEFLKWKIEEIPLFDFYSVRAGSRPQQLGVLRQWVEQRSIMFLSYKQFSSIVCDSSTSTTSTACQEILLMCPSILIMDEGHTSRNKETEIMTSLVKVQTPRKVVLSGTLYQNHVEEVFNILNLVRPHFLNREPSKSIKRRIESSASVPRNRRNPNFFEIVEHTLLKENDSTKKASLILDLRAMTSNVLQYYKGDSLDDLPGLMDFTVVLKLHPRQEREVVKLKNLSTRFKLSSEGSAIYVHHRLKDLCRHSEGKERVDEKRIDKTIADLDIREGAKAKFYINLLELCEAMGEKLLVFSQYLLPMKFLERLTIKLKGYSTGKEIFFITGDSDSVTLVSSLVRSRLVVRAYHLLVFLELSYWMFT